MLRRKVRTVLHPWPSNISSSFQALCCLSWQKSNQIPASSFLARPSCTIFLLSMPKEVTLIHLIPRLNASPMKKVPIISKAFNTQSLAWFHFLLALLRHNCQISWEDVMLQADGMAGCALMGLAWIVCRIQLISSDLAAARALIPASSKASLVGANPRPIASTDPGPTARKLGGSRLGYWLAGLSCGAGAVLLYSYMKRLPLRSNSLTWEEMFPTQYIHKFS